MRPTAHESEPPQRTRRGELLLQISWAIGTLLVSIRVIGAKLFLVYLYGWTRVQQEQLRILKMPKNAPWPVSNGDVITQGYFIHFLISGACWFVIFFAIYPLLRLLLPR